MGGGYVYTLGFNTDLRHQQESPQSLTVCLLLSSTELMACLEHRQTPFLPSVGWTNARKIHGRFIGNGHWLKAKSSTHGKVPATIEGYPYWFSMISICFHRQGTRSLTNMFDISGEVPFPGWTATRVRPCVPICKLLNLVQTAPFKNLPELAGFTGYVQDPNPYHVSGCSNLSSIKS